MILPLSVSSMMMDLTDCRKSGCCSVVSCEFIVFSCEGFSPPSPAYAGSGSNPCLHRGRLFPRRGGRDFYPHPNPNPQGERTYGECMFFVYDVYDTHERLCCQGEFNRKNLA